MNIDFSDQTVLVTGASRGIGQQIADDLAAAGATLVVTATTAADESAALHRWGAATTFFAVDFRDQAATEDFLLRLREFDRIDACINNAGLTRHHTLQETSLDDWQTTEAVNLRAPFLVTQAVAAVMQPHRYGRIVNISSIWGHITIRQRTAYTMAKHGLNGLTRSAAVDLAPYQILVNSVSPGFTLTDMVRRNYSPEQLQAVVDRVPLGRAAEPADISRAVLFLASRQNSFITGQNLVVDGGYSIV